MCIRRILQSHVSGKKTTHEAYELQDKRNALYRRIENWRQVQTVYMPAVVGLRLSALSMEESPVTHPESSLLYLPSDLPEGFIIAGDLPDKERRLRLAQVNDSLLELKRLLRITMGLWEYKYSQLGSGQHPNTRAHALIDRYHDKIDCCAM